VTNFLKGMCYAPFPHGYDPSTANNTCIWFGSDIADCNVAPLWGESFSPVDGPDKGKVFKGRDDLGNLKNLGVNLIRLYDWDPRKNHMPFLDYCHQLGIQVLVPASNYFLGAFGPAPDMIESITLLINSFEVNNDYHPAIYGITIGCELDQVDKVSIDYVIAFTKKWMEIENMAYRGFRKVRIGHPISFATAGPGWIGYYPCFGYLDKLLPPLKAETMRDLNTRLMICPHTYNEASFLFDSARGAKQGWVDLTYDRYKLPILFCEIGCSRLIRTDYQTVIRDQLERSIQYNDTNKLLGSCYFQYVDKVWMPNTTEGTFGLYKNTNETTDVVRYGLADFPNHTEVGCKDNFLNVQVLEANPALDVLKNIYTKEDNIIEPIEKDSLKEYVTNVLHSNAPSESYEITNGTIIKYIDNELIIEKDGKILGIIKVRE
jgi:hypothetical protein